MANPWAAWPGGALPPALARDLAVAQEHFFATGRAARVRPVVLDSWRRSRASGVDPDRTRAEVDLDDLDSYRAAHPLAQAMPVVRRLLVDAASDAGLVVAVTDAVGRLLWVEGARTPRAEAASMNFVEGAVWDEAQVGTNAPGTALVLDHAVQVFSTEHFSRVVHGWSCSAAPVHDPGTGAILGAIDITGGDHVASPQTLALVQATAAAVEAELRLALLVGALPGQRAADSADRLEVLGRDQAVLHLGGRRLELSRRHSELLLLLALRPGGASAEELAVALNEHEPALVTVRAELSRLRRVLGESTMASRPYRLVPALATDVGEVRALLARGALRKAFDRYGGPVLPRSQAPGVVGLRRDLEGQLRASVLGFGGGELLLDYARSPQAYDDLEVWEAVLAASRAGTPRWSRAAARVRQLRVEFGVLAAATSLQRRRA